MGTYHTKGVMAQNRFTVIWDDGIWNEYQYNYRKKVQFWEHDVLWNVNDLLKIHTYSSGNGERDFLLYILFFLFLFKAYFNW